MDLNKLSRCEYCLTPARDYMRVCAKCGLALLEDQRELFRANVLLEEAGRWLRTGIATREVAEGLIFHYRVQHDEVMARLVAQSPNFRPEALPTAVVAAAPVEAAAPAVAAPVQVEIPEVTPIPVAAPEVLVTASPVEAVAPVLLPVAQVAEPVVAAAAAVPVAMPSPFVAARAVAGAGPGNAAPVEVVREKRGQAVASTPRASWSRRNEGPAPAAEERILGVLSESQLGWLANTAIVAIVIAVMLLIQNHWGTYAPGTKVGCFALGTILAMGIGAALRGTVLRTTGNALFVIGALSIPLVFAGTVWFGAVEPEKASTMGFVGAGICTGVYYGLARLKGHGWFAWLGAAAILVGTGFGIDAGGMPIEVAPAVFAVVGAGLAGIWAAKSERLELGVAGACAVVGAMLGGIVAAGSAPLLATVITYVVAAAGFAAVAVRSPEASHGVWASLAILSVLAPISAHASWSARPMLPALLSLGFFAAARTGTYEKTGLAGGTILAVITGCVTLGAFSFGAEMEGHRALLMACVVLIPGFSWTAYRRDETAWASVALLLPAGIAVATKALFHLPNGFLPVGLGAYAAGLYALALREDAHARAAAPVGLVAHAVALLACCTPGAQLPTGALPFYWNELGWRAALALAIPGATILALHVRRDPNWLLAGEVSLIGAALFMARQAGVTSSWAPALGAMAALGFVAAYWNRPAARQAQLIGAVAALPALVAGVLAWSDPAGPWSFTAAAAVLGALAASARDPRALPPSIFAAGLAVSCFAHRMMDPGPAPLVVTIGYLSIGVAAAWGMKDRDWRRAVAVPAALVSGAALFILALRFGPLALPGSLAPAFGGAMFAAGALAIGLKRDMDEEAWSFFGAAVACIAAASLAQVHLPMEKVGSIKWLPAACALLPACFVALGTWARDLKQGHSWAIVGAIGVAVSLALGLTSGAFPFGVVALVGAAAAVSAIRFAPAPLSFIAASLANGAFVAFLVHGGVPGTTAAPALMAVAVVEAAAASLVARNAVSNAIFGAAGAFAIGGLVWGFSECTVMGRQVDLLPAIICVAITGGAAVLVGLIRRQPYLYMVAVASAAAEYVLALQQAGITTIEAYTWPPAALVLVAAHFIERRKITIVTGQGGEMHLEARLSRHVLDFAAIALEQIGSIRIVAIVAALLPTVWRALPVADGGHTPMALAAGAVVLILGVMGRRKQEASLGALTVGGLSAVKAFQWMVEQNFGVAWWILIVGTSLLGLVALAEMWRHLVLKGKSERFKALVETYLSGWKN